MTVVQELEQKKVELATAESKVVEVQKAMEVSIVKASEEVAAMQAKIDESVKAIECVTVERDTLKASLDASGVKIAELEGELAKAKEALANPAFAQAAVAGDKKAVEEGGSEAAHKMTKVEALAEYKKIVGAKERAEFRKAHKEELGL